MVQQNKLMQSLGIPFAALVSVIFGLMFISFPIGAYVFFNSQLGDSISFDFPIKDMVFFSSEIAEKIPSQLEIGDVFIGIWCIFIVLFALAMFGSKKNFLAALSPIMSGQKFELESNNLVAVIKWFSIIIVISGIIDFVQKNIGITIEPPQVPNDLIQFFSVTAAPIGEEIMFRVILIGIPLFVMYSQRASIKLFFKSLWRPSHYLNVHDKKKAVILVVTVGIIFGLAHIISEESWSSGKFSQAAASGIIIGWVYFRYGFGAAVLIHWATNYFIFSFVYFLAEINGITIKNAFSHSMTDSLEILFIVTGIISIAIISLEYLSLKKKKEDEDLIF